MSFKFTTSDVRKINYVVRKTVEKSTSKREPAEH